MNVIQIFYKVALSEKRDLRVETEVLKNHFYTKKLKTNAKQH
jgi:hypothetical protein